jgi:hypothetical protein
MNSKRRVLSFAVLDVRIGQRACKNTPVASVPPKKALQLTWHSAIQSTFLKQENVGLKVWTRPFTELRAPGITNLRMDPFERAEDEGTAGYQDWYAERMFMFAPAAGYVAQWLQSFREFPPRQEPASFSLGKVMEMMKVGSKGGGN